MNVIHATGYFTMAARGLVAMGAQLEPDSASFSRNMAKSASPYRTG